MESNWRERTKGYARSNGENKDTPGPQGQDEVYLHTNVKNYAVGGRPRSRGINDEREDMASEPPSANTYV